MLSCIIIHISEQFAEQVYTIFLGAEEISEIRDMMANETNYEKSLVMNLVLKQDSGEDFYQMFGFHFDNVDYSADVEI